MIDDARIDDLAIASALRRLDALAEQHSELRGPSGPDNVNAWIATLDDDEKGTPVPTEPTTQVAFRFTDRLLERIDQHAKRLAAGKRNVKYSRAEVVRELLERALDEVEAADRRRGGKS